jgi:hypothetical protein
MNCILQRRECNRSRRVDHGPPRVVPPA